MKRAFLFALVGLVLGVVACAPKTENPSITGVTYDRLYREGWEAYAQGDYALAQAKFDTILAQVTAADPLIYISKAFALIPQRRVSDVDAQVSIALALKGGDPFQHPATLPITGATVVSASPFVFQVNTAVPFYGFVEGVSFQTVADVNGWAASVALGPGHDATTAIGSGSVPLGLSGGNFTFLLSSLEDSGVVFSYAGAQGTVLNTLSLPDSSQPPSLLLDTVVYVPGETLVVETTYVYPTVNVNVLLDVPLVDDSLSGSFLVRDGSVTADTLSVLAYLARAAAAYMEGLSDPVKMARSAALAAATQALLDEMGLTNFDWDPLGDGRLAGRFSYTRTQILQARAYLRMQLFKNAARKVNEIYGSVQIPEDTTFTPEVIQTLVNLIEQVEG